jgi:hypothetical protein
MACKGFFWELRLGTQFWEHQHIQLQQPRPRPSDGMGTWRGKDQGLTLGKPRSCPTVLVSQTLSKLPSGLRTCTPLGSEEGRKLPPRRRGTLRSDTLQPRPSAGSTRQRAIGYDRIAKQSTLS